MARHSTVSQWQLQVSLNYLVVENEEHPISDVLDVPIGKKKHIQPVQMNEEAMDVPDTNRRKELILYICEDLKFQKKENRI